MRTARILAPWGKEAGGKPAIYHCLSRVVDRQFLFKRAEKEQFVHFLKLYARFCGVELLTYCVMSNHFHLLAEVPPHVEEEMSDESFLARLRVLYPEGKVALVAQQLEAARRAGDEARVSALRARYTYRMGDLGEFMKTLKQRFSQWYNKRHGRRGTLWEERYTSVLVEDGYAARVIAAYIDLNPVRAGLVQDPKDYRWCGYAAALAGNKGAKAGLKRLMSEYEHCATGVRRPLSQRAFLAEYRLILFEDGEEVFSEDGKGECRIARKGMSSRAVEKVRQAGGVLGRSQLLRHRVRTFAAGAVLGSRQFVEEVMGEVSGRAGPRRSRSKPKAMSESALPLCSLRGA